jgi:hypothetical protein
MPPASRELMLSAVGAWRLGLCIVAALNVLAWALAVAALKEARSGLPADSYAARRLQLSLSAVYVFGCVFRSALPVFDIPREVLTDSWLSSVAVGRSVATVAELCFAGQWAVFLLQCARTTGSRFVLTASLAVVPMIAVAECCSWYAVLTTDNAGHVAENSLWGLTAALVLCSMAAVRADWKPERRRMLLAWCVTGAAYVAFIFLADVPGYWARWIADHESGRHYLSIAQGLHDVSTRWVVSDRWSDWKSEVTWMSLYFSVGVWVSISLTYVSARAMFSAPREPTRASPPPGKLPTEPPLRSAR